MTSAVAVGEIWNELATSTEAPAKKPRMTNYKNMHRSIDTIMLEHCIAEQVRQARMLAERRFDEMRTPSESVARLEIEAYGKNTICSTGCVAETIPVVLYMVDWAESPQDREQMRAAYHMFFQPISVEVAGRLGLVTKLEQAKRTLHVCSPYCPFVIARRYPHMYTADDDPDRPWTTDWCHVTQLKNDYVPDKIYRCQRHNRFHVCSSTCEYVAESQSAGVKLCPLSQRAVADDMIKHSFGDGVGTAEQHEKTSEAKGGEDSDGCCNDVDKRRRLIVQSRNQLYESATIEVNGRRVRRGSGDRVTSEQRKIRIARKTTPDDQQKRQIASITAREVAACRPYNRKSTERELPTTISAIARVPFSERAAKDNHEFALDALHEMLHRAQRRTTFTFSEQVSRRVLFGNPDVFAKCCERAAAIFYHLFLGNERRAKEQTRFDTSRVQAERSADQYVARCETLSRPPTLAECVGQYEATLNVKTRRYSPAILSAEMYAALEAYYAIRATIFFFGLLSLPVRNRAMMRADMIDMFKSAFGFESFCVVIYDLMHTGYGVRNVTNLARDTFIAERLFPSSSTLKHLGMLEKPVTNIKSLITTIFKAVQPHGISPQYVLDTTLPWTRIAEISTLENPARRVVEELLEKRDRQLAMLQIVRPPSPDTTNE